MTSIETRRDEVAALIGRVADRDTAAFGALYDRTSAKLFGLLLRMLGDRGEAEDALQEVFIKIWRGAPRYARGGASPMSWLIAIARNHAVDRLRARTAGLREAAGEAEAEALPHRGPGPEDLAVAASEAARIGACLDTLEDRRADAVRGAYLNGDSYEELATRFGVPLNTMRTWLRRSLIKLRECLGA